MKPHSWFASAAFAQASGAGRLSLLPGSAIGTLNHEERVARLVGEAPGYIDLLSDTRTKYLNTGEAAEYLGVSVRTMNRYRVTGYGPPYYRLGGRVRYARAELDEWVTGSKRTSTSDDDPE